MNKYIKLFYRLSQLGKDEGLEANSASDFGFYMSDLEALHIEKYIFVKESAEKKGTRYILLAPKGFASLEEYFKDKRDNERNKLLRDSTILLAMATILGILFQIWEKIGSFFDNVESIPIWTSGLFWFIAISFILLFILKTIKIIFSKESWKGLLFSED